MKEKSLNRYAKQSILPEIGEVGQKAIEAATVLCVGAGGLGSPILQYLAAAGVGRIGIIDSDRVELSNLQRQVLFQEHQVGERKVDAAKENLEKLNSNIQIEIFPHALSTENVENIFLKFDIIIDGTDNFEAKYLINDAAVKLKKPVVFGSVTGFEGQVGVFDSSTGPCYRCLYPLPSESAIPNCAEAGVLGAVVGIVGSLQAAECLKYIISSQTTGKILNIDIRDLSFLNVKINKNPSCSVCTIPREEIIFEHSICKEDLLKNPDDYVLIDVREKEEWDEGVVPGAIHLPLSTILSDGFEVKTLKIDFSKKIVTYCRSGSRAKKANRILEKQGFPKIYLFHY